MGYCSVAEVENILAQTLTTATDANLQGRVDLMRVGRTRDRSVISTDVVEQYILWADQEIDAHLSELYKTPIGEYADMSVRLAESISDYNQYIVLNVRRPLAVGDTVILKHGSTEERHTISAIINVDTFETEEPIQFAFEAGDRVIRVQFPQPLPWIAARLAAANLYDKFFSAESAPNITEYGKLLRQQARQKINDILNGRTILHGPQRIGRRLYDPTIPDQYGLPNGSEGAKDTDQLQ